MGSVFSGIVCHPPHTTYGTISSFLKLTPSPILEERTRDNEFREYVHGLLTTIGNQAIIIGVGDMVLGNNLIERVRYIAAQVEKHTLNPE